MCVCVCLCALYQAMSTETMSSNPSDWTQFYQQNLSNQVLPPGRILSGSMFGDRVSDATVVTTTITSASTPSPLGAGNSSSGAGHLSPEGRVSKPIRRRSRASRRTPTTLLNTDTTNFRAMVQQFTGGPSAPFASGSQLNAPNFNFGLGVSRQVHVNPSSVMMPAGYHLQFQQQQQQQHNQQYQQQSQGSYMFSLGNNNINPGDMFLHRLGNPRPTSMEVSDGFVTESVSSLVPPPSRAAPSSSNENRSNTFLF